MDVLEYFWIGSFIASLLILIIVTAGGAILRPHRLLVGSLLMAWGADIALPPYPTLDLPFFLIFMSIFAPAVIGNDIWNPLQWGSMVANLGSLYVIYIFCAVVIGLLVAWLGYKIGKGGAKS